MKRLLIANRGEIVVRVARTARRLGIRTVAVYSDADRGAPHVRACDEAFYLGPTPASQSYLAVNRIVEVARRAGADAVHPGYGFLSERAEFARAVVDAGLIFVGPSAEVMEQMGRKDHARMIASAAGVPVVPGFAPDDVGDDAFPVLVKAAAGGGGKGMRVVGERAELAAALAAARREAASSFGDDTLLVERYVARGRHVEVQVLGDSHGTVLHFHERDCSSQRRHQKVLEEAPPPGLTDAVRDRLTEAAVALAREVGYTNAGTVEFLVDPERGIDGVYFLEMNTRLQVEHPVTELAVRGRGQPLDLVELQLRVADGEPLPLTQDEIMVDGHAIEARIYAEDAFNGFLPQAGRASLVRWSPRARNDQALESGQTVSSAYDPMLGKVIVHGPDRETARDALVEALDDTVILGLTTNTGFVRQLAASNAFGRTGKEGGMDTAWLDRHADQIRRPDEPLAAVFAACVVAAGVGVDRDPSDPFATADGWRLAGPAAPVSLLLLPDDSPSGTPQRWAVTPDRVIGPADEWPVRVVSAENHVLTLEVDQMLRSAVVDATKRRVEVSLHGSTYAFDRPDPREAAGSAAISGGTLLAKMPGTVLAVEVGEGDRVVEGQSLGVLEAMKMELVLTAPFAGVVTRVGAHVGQQVAMDAVLFEVEEAADA